MDTRFTKVIVARQNPKNKCYVSDGEVLYVVPRADIPLKEHVSHHFVTVRDPRVTSQYGWVQQVAPFTLDEFTTSHLKDRPLSPSDEEHLQTMFRAIEKLAPDTPVAATYSSRGVENKRMVFTVHRVIFYKR